jgi:uncharacterized membrane protein
VVSDNVLALVFGVFGLLFGSLLPGYLTYLVLQLKEFGFNRKLALTVLKATVILTVATFIVLAIIGYTLELLAVPADHPPSSIALGFGVIAGFIGGLIALIIGISRGKSSANTTV